MRQEAASNGKAQDESDSAVADDTGPDAKSAAKEASDDEAVLILAEDNVSPAEYRGVLSPELRARLDAMTRDYARILTRIDRLAESRAETNGEIRKSDRDSVV